MPVGLCTCRQAKKLVWGCDPHTTKQLLNRDKASLKVAVGMLTRHNGLRYHLNNMIWGSDPSCRECEGTPKTAKHFLSYCPGPLPRGSLSDSGGCQRSTSGRIFRCRKKVAKNDRRIRHNGPNKDGPVSPWCTGKTLIGQRLKIILGA